jgi:hypothetical protein
MHWERRTRDLIVQGIFWLVVLQVIMTCGGEPKRSAVERIPDPTYKPKRGDGAMLYGYDRARDRFYGPEVALSEFAYEEFWRALEVGDGDGANEVVTRGHAVRIAPKTGVLVLEVRKFPEEDARPDLAVCRVLDGPLKGRKVYVPTFQVCQLIENPAFSPPKVAEAPKEDPGKPRRKTFEEMTPEEVKAVREGAARQMADSYFNIAENLRKSGKYAAARKQYQEVIRDFGSHPEAKLARERLKSLPK